MSRAIVWTANALAGVEAIADFELQRSPARAEAVVDKILQRVESLAEFPFASAPYLTGADRGVRRLVFDTFVVIYRVPDGDAAIQVLAVRHQRQRPVDVRALP